MSVTITKTKDKRRYLQSLEKVIEGCMAPPETTRCLAPHRSRFGVSLGATDGMTLGVSLLNQCLKELLRECENEKVSVSILQFLELWACRAQPKT